MSGLITRRRLLTAGATVPWLAACKDGTPPLEGGWLGAAHERGHQLRNVKSGSLGTPAVERRAGVLVVGAGIAGLGCARALARHGIDDVQLLDLEDTPGGNSRGHAIAGMACPLGAHYLPTPGDEATEVIALLEELKLRRTEHGRTVYEERHLCHSPQERIFIEGAWHDGLLPPVDALPEAEHAQTLTQYRQFAAEVTAASRSDGGPPAFAIPSARGAWGETQAALDATTFAQWLDARGLTAPALRWYLDYCCRDDYGAGAAQVSAWAGLHYFASRHGFHAPGSASDERDGVLTWPEGNAWLMQRLGEPVRDRLHTGRIALRVRELRHGVEVDVLNAATTQLERWTAPQVVLALPLFIAARLVEQPGDALRDAARRMRHAPWLVANLHLDRPLVDRPGTLPAWDSVIYGSNGLGYVDAMHQSTRPHAGPTVLTAYVALGGDSAEQAAKQRAALLSEPWTVWASRVLDDLSAAHPDLRAKVRRVDLMRYGHAMSIPLPGIRSSAALQALSGRQARVHYAHADLSGYSIFEEALYHGERAAADVRRLMG